MSKFLNQDTELNFSAIFLCENGDLTMLKIKGQIWTLMLEYMGSLKKDIKNKQSLGIIFVL